jgi:hypothetical protein
VIGDVDRRQLAGADGSRELGHAEIMNLGHVTEQ